MMEGHVCAAKYKEILRDDLDSTTEMRSEWDFNLIEGNNIVETAQEKANCVYKWQNHCFFN